MCSTIAKIKEKSQNVRCATGLEDHQLDRRKLVDAKYIADRLMEMTNPVEICIVGHWEVAKGGKPK